MGPKRIEEIKEYIALNNRLLKNKGTGLSRLEECLTEIKRLQMEIERLREHVYEPTFHFHCPKCNEIIALPED